MGYAERLIEASFDNLFNDLIDYAKGSLDKAAEVNKALVDWELADYFDEWLDEGEDE